MKLYSIRLLVRDFDASFRFYHHVMGLEVVWGEEGGRYAEFKTGDRVALAIFKRDAMAVALDVKDPPSGVPAQDHTVLILEVDDLEETVATLRERGAHFVTEPTDYPAWTIRAAHLRDPDGNLIEVFTALPEERWTEEVREADRRSKAKQ